MRPLPKQVVARSVGTGPRTLEAQPNNSLDLTICEWHGAQLRYYNLLAEQHEFHNADPARKARWTRATRQLVAYDRDKIFKLRVNVSGFGDREARAAAVRLAKRAVRELRA